jgi:TRAP-type mannitol/chloroaromatic compound transport system permease small subunit
VLRNNGHVRVDVFYSQFSPRLKALVDVATSLFFFIFAATLLWTGWTFLWLCPS